MEYQKTASGLLVPAADHALQARAQNAISKYLGDERMRKRAAEAMRLFAPDDNVDTVRLGGVFCVQHLRGDELIDEDVCHNLVTNEGLNHMLGVELYSTAQITAWYLALFTGNYTPLATDTAASLPGNSTECTAYTAGTRPQFVSAAPSGQSVTNSASRASYTFNATVTIYGAFMTSSATISGTSGTSFSAALFGTSKSVVNTDQILLTYTFAATSS
jgi:hypothetical protein